MTLNRIIFEITTWWRKRSLYRACPRLRALTMAEQKAKASHKATRHFEREKQRVMNDLLRGGI